MAQARAFQLSDMKVNINSTEAPWSVISFPELDIHLRYKYWGNALNSGKFKVVKQEVNHFIIQHRAVDSPVIKVGFVQQAEATLAIEFVHILPAKQHGSDFSPAVTSYMFTR